MIPTCIASPFSFVIICFFIYHEIGFRLWLPCTILFVLLNITIVMKIKNVERKNLYSHMSSKRALVLNEMIPNIKIVKLYSMESLFGKVLMKIRASELRALRIIHFNDSILSFIDIMMPILCSAASIAYYNVSTSSILSIEDTYAIVSVFLVSTMPFRAVSNVFDKFGYYKDSMEAFKLFMEKIIEKGEDESLGGGHGSGMLAKTSLESQKNSGNFSP